jgi:hypothetical protein
MSNLEINTNGGLAFTLDKRAEGQEQRFKYLGTNDITETKEGRKTGMSGRNGV